MNISFNEVKNEFDRKFCNATEFECFLPDHLSINKTTYFRGKDGLKNEQYYKWQFLYSIVHSGLFPRDLIGTEIHLPKGNKSSAPIILDGAIFSNAEWFDVYKNYHLTNNTECLDWLRKHLIVALEFKRENNKNISDVWEKQLKPYMKESDAEFCVGVLYDTERLFLFRKHNNKYLRYSDEYNIKGIESGTKELSLHLPDPYRNIPSLNRVLDWTKIKNVDRTERSINNLEIISGLQSTQVNDAMSSILRTMDKLGMVNQKGFEILVQILSLKIFDEKRNETQPNRHLVFYIQPEEQHFNTLADAGIQNFLKRIKLLRTEASGTYYRILKDNLFNEKDEKHVRILTEVVWQFQDYSFVKSHKTDLYQLVFYKFAGQFAKDQNAQFITPLPIIDFLVNIVNPRNGETVIDPTVGIADFLSVSYVNSKSKLDDKNIFGMDIDDQMVMLATLNMLLNGDGNAKIISQADGYGSLLTKFSCKGEPLQLISGINDNGNWDERPDTEQLKKFDVVLTNPPFGEDRAFVPKDDKDLSIIKCYELWNLYNPYKITSKIDLGVVFLENAYRILRENGRLGIVISNSIASIDSHRIVRQWLMDKMRIVALFDLPANVFAETGVNTTIIVAYKPTSEELKRLKEQNYEIFIRDIQKVGYEVKTSKRVKFFSPTYKINYSTFETEIDKDGNPVLDEDFTQTIMDFREWCLGQEITLQDLFIKEK